jgi:1,4-alpha-glucan branching enzyme
VPFHPTHVTNPRSFAAINGDNNSTNIPSGNKPSSSTLYSAAIAEFGGDFSWGYNPAHIFAVESSYGGPQGFKEFVKAAHKIGLGVILDVVYNHFRPCDLNLWQFDGWNENGLGGIYFYNDWRCETPWGNTRPDYGRGEVRKFIRDNAMMWLEEYHVDGLRMDMTLYIRSVHPGADLPDGWSLAQWLNSEVNRHFPGRITIAEDLQHNEWLTKDSLWGALVLEHNGIRTSFIRFEQR